MSKKLFIVVIIIVIEVIITILALILKYFGVISNLTKEIFVGTMIFIDHSVLPFYIIIGKND